VKQFLIEASATRAKFLLTSRRDEEGWLGELPRRIKVPPMPMQERAQLARRIVERRGGRMNAVENWLPLLRYSGGNPMTITVVVGQAMRDGIRTAEQLEHYVIKLRTGGADLADDEAEGRERSLAASLSYGFANAFSAAEHRILALLHLFQGFVDVDALVLMAYEDTGDLRFLREYGLDQAKGIALLDRTAEVGLLEPLGDGYYRIHPALPWYFRDLFDGEFPPVSDPGTPSAVRVQRAYVEAMGNLGSYCLNQYEDGNSNFINLLVFEEANLLFAWRLATTNGWWDGVIGTMQGLGLLYNQTGQRTAWRRLVEAVVPAFCDPQSDGPLPGREENWSIVIGYRVRIALKERELPLAERLQQALVVWQRQRSAGLLNRPTTELSLRERYELESLGVALYGLAEVQRQQGEASCIDSYKAALAFAEQTGDRSRAAACAFSLGNTFVSLPNLHDIDKAEHWYHRSLDLSLPGDRLVRARIIKQLGSIALERFDKAKWRREPKPTLLKHLNTAMEHYQQALYVLPQNAINDLAVSHNALGRIYRRMDDQEQLRYHYDEAIRYFESAENLYGAAQARENLAIALCDDGQYERARRYAELALQNYARYGAGAAQEVAKVQGLLADIDEVMGNSAP
jgi:tetratricopeptide (TPR) repeat protein